MPSPMSAPGNQSLEEVLDRFIRLFELAGPRIHSRSEEIFSGYVAEALRATEARHGAWAQEFYPMLGPEGRGAVRARWAMRVDFVLGQVQHDDQALALEALAALLERDAALKGRLAAIALNAALAVAGEPEDAAYVEPERVIRGWMTETIERHGDPATHRVERVPPKMVPGAPSPLAG